MAVALDQKFRRAGECPVCEGGDSMKRGRGERCFGYTMRDGNAVVCTREEYAGDIPLNTRAKGYVHVLDRPCKCGVDHASAYRLDPLPKRETPKAEPKQSHKAKAPTAIYSYRDDLRKLRYGHGAGKYFVWQHQNTDGEWWNCDGCSHEPGLYQPTVNIVNSSRLVFLVEGEGKADALAERGALAVSVPDGAGSWRAEYAPRFAGHHAVILVDADKNGRELRQSAETSLADVAASVRSLELEGAHDVVDWLADGHTLVELLMIIACLPSAQQSTPTTQDASSDESQKSTSCQNCQRWHDRATIAETSLANLRRDIARLDRVMAIDNEKVPAPTKVITYAAVRELSKARARNGNGMMQTYRAALAKRAGVKEQAAGSQLMKASKAGLVAREMTRTFDDATLYIGEGPMLDDPEANANIPTPERANGWGGKRVKGCPHCHSTDIVATTYACTNCGAHLRADELVDVAYEESIPTTQEELSPLYSMTHLASDGGELACPEEPVTPCAITGGAHIYGMMRRADGTRICTECAEPMPQPWRAFHATLESVVS